MKVIYDSQIFRQQEYGGISRYFFELLSEFQNDDEIYTELLLKKTSNYYLCNSNLINEFKKNVRSKSDLNNERKQFVDKIKARIEKSFFIKSALFKKIYSRYKKKIDCYFDIKMLKKRSFDLFHPTYYDPYFLEYLRGKPFVLTVHDMIHEKFANEFLRLKNKVILQKKELIKKARHIIAISESTKKDIIDIYQIPESKISVVYLGYKQIANNCFHESNFPDKYILYVGDRALYKNFQFFLKSISSYLKMEEDLYLVCVGGREFTYDEKELINKFELASKMIHYPKVSDDFIRAAYQNALGFIFPSLYEGFGLPVLEAFVNGCPAVLSNTSSLPEVGGDAALYFDPRNSESILESVRKIVTDIKLREELKQRGYSRLKKFSWQKCAEETKQVYQSII